MHCSSRFPTTDEDRHPFPLQEKHVQEVLDSVKEEEEKKRGRHEERMETTLRNREEQLKAMIERLREHVRVGRETGGGGGA